MSISPTNQECCCCSYMNCRKPPLKTDYPKKKLLTRAIESFYDNCAAYNLRYIPYRTVTDRKTCLRSIMKDFWILFCFLVTNFIVLLTILSRIAMHFGGVCLATIDWIKQMVQNKAYQKPHLRLLYKERGNGNGNFDPPLTTKDTADEYCSISCNAVGKPTTIQT